MTEILKILQTAEFKSESNLKLSLPTIHQLLSFNYLILKQDQNVFDLHFIQFVNDKRFDR